MSRSKWQGQPKGLRDANRRRTQEALDRQEAAKQAAWAEEKHPRHPAGAPEGGRFRPGDRVSGRSVFSTEKLEGEVVEVLDSGIVVKTDEGEERVVRKETAEHVGNSGLAGSSGTIRGVRNPQAPSRPRGPRHRRYDPEALIAAGRWSPAQQAKIAKVMEEFKAGTLENGHGGKVTSKRQALAIALSKAKELTAAVHPVRDALPGFKPSLVSAGGWDESKHPRNPEGSKGGGQFTTKAAGRMEADKALAEQRKQFGQKGVEEMVQDELSDEGRARGREMGSDDTTEEFHQGWEERMREEQAGPGWAPESTANATLHPSNAPANPARPPDTAHMDDLEARAQVYVDAGYQPTDGEPGEWITMSHPDGDEITLDVNDEYDGQNDPDAHSNAYEEDFLNEEELRGSALTAAAAGLAPMNPPRSWFDKPKLDGPTPITVTADGQVYGHAALWGTCHTGMAGVCRTPPRSQSDYAYFHLGELDTDEGPVHVGRVTMDTGHAPLTASRDATVRHYDDTGTGAAHVRAYEDEHGIVLAGALMPDIPAEKARRMRGATVSGDWRSIGGKLELVGMLAVNVPGFPVPRAMAASLMIEDEPHTMALVAAGLPDVDPEVFDRKVKVLTARAMGGVDGLTELALGGDKTQRRMGVTAAAFDPAKHPRKPKGPGGGQFANLAGLSDEAAAEAVDSISFNDKVTIMVPAGIGRDGPEYKEKTGRARIKSKHGWALNMGGAHGTPGVATERNIVKVKPAS